MVQALRLISSMFNVYHLCFMHKYAVKMFKHSFAHILHSMEKRLIYLKRKSKFETLTFTVQCSK